MSPLTFRERPAQGDPRGLLVLHHGRGADERDLLLLADALDSRRELHVVTPRAPLALAGWKGYHWYAVPRVGHPDPETFKAAYRALATLHDELWQRTGIAASSTVLGGFSMGTAMSYALALGADRPPMAGILAFSGFIPVLDGWQPDLGSRRSTRAFIAHGRHDPVIDVSFARAARDQLLEGGIDVEYHESETTHQIDPFQVPPAADWLERTISSEPQGKRSQAGG